MRIVGITHHFKSPENSAEDVSPLWDYYFGNGIYDTLSKLSNDNPAGVHGFLQVMD